MAKTFKFYTYLFLILLGITLGITACVQVAPLSTAKSTVTKNKINLRNEQGSGQLSTANSALKPKFLHSAKEKPTIWTRIRGHLQLTSDQEDQPEVQRQIRDFIHNPDTLWDMLDDAAPYIGYVYSQVEKRHLPAELALLPLIESKYDPWATNGASGAAGMWQLMRGTASDYGVREYWAFDGRRDLYSSTKAALDYLTYLRDFFDGDWLLAIAAYDTGPGNVQNAVDDNSYDGDDTDFWDLSLSYETRSYVPRLLALAAIIKHPEKYDVTLPPISEQPHVALVSVGSQGMSLKHAAKLAKMHLSDLEDLNPAIYSSSYRLRHGKLTLPMNKVAIYKKSLAA